jgi:hypothetical protein
MDEQSTEELDSQNQPTEEVVNTEEVEVETPADDTEDLESLQEKNKKLFERAKKAEAEAKLLKAERLKAEEQARRPAEKQADVTLKDQIALVQAQVNPDDIDEVLRYAKFADISIADALKSNVVKTILSERTEQRKSAEVANTQGSRRTVPKVSDEQLIEKADRGDVPDDPEALVEARFNQKKNNGHK